MANDSTRKPRLPTYFSAQDKHRLCEFAPKFLIQVEPHPDSTITLRLGLPSGKVQEVTLPEEKAYRRLVNEIGERVVNWHYFHQREDAKQTLLKLPDDKLNRLAELYKLSLAGKASSSPL